MWFRSLQIAGTFSALSLAVMLRGMLGVFFVIIRAFMRNDKSDKENAN
tara:strand:- start:12729 stop:12872 length:144 start_codon:yes stop_codon:yes gene_type:complete